MGENSVEVGGGGKFRIDVQRVHIAGDQCEQLNVLSCQGALQRGRLADDDFLERSIMYSLQIVGVYRNRTGHGFDPEQDCGWRGF
ncbi:hypothetical protein D3C84_1027680 [compost metagenome]